MTDHYVLFVTEMDLFFNHRVKKDQSITLKSVDALKKHVFVIRRLLSCILMKTRGFWWIVHVKKPG